MFSSDTSIDVFFSNIIFKQQSLHIVIERWHQWSKACKEARLKAGRFSSQLALSYSYAGALCVLLVTEMFIAVDNGWGSAFTQNSVTQLRQMLNDDLYILGESVTELSPPAGFASTGSSVHEAMLEAR